MGEGVAMVLRIFTVLHRLSVVRKQLLANQSSVFIFSFKALYVDAGLASQEVVKLVTHQYIPIDHTLIYNGMVGNVTTLNF